MSTDDDISRLYQQGNEQQPPAHLDNAILNAAKDAASDTTQSPAQNSTDKTSVAKGPFSGGWPRIASIAAVLVIAVILVPLIEQEEPSEMASDSINGKQKVLLEQKSLDRDDAERPNTIKTKQRTISAQKKVKEEAHYSLQAPAATSGKAQTVQNTSASDSIGSSVSKRKERPIRERYIDEEKNISTKRSTLNFNGLMSIKNSESETAPTESLRHTQGRFFSHDLEEDEISSTTLSPQAWLEKIQRLIKLENIELAQKELDAFKSKYPDEKIEQSILNSLK